MFKYQIRRRRCGRMPGGRKQAPTNAAVFAVPVTDNQKLGPLSATFAAQQSCPESCVFFGNGCFAESGWPALTVTRRLNDDLPENITPEQIALEEAAAIDKLLGDRDLRLHVVGDCATIEAAKIIADSARRYIDRGGKKVFTYTHSWRIVPRWAWGPISVLASCETEEEIIEARIRGYATAVVVEEYTGDKLRRSGNVNQLPCPQETRGVTCADCRLCMDDKRLYQANITIQFVVHGAGKNKAIAALTETKLKKVVPEWWNEISLTTRRPMLTYKRTIDSS